MSSTSRDLVMQTLEFRAPSRAPRQLWVLPWAERNYPEQLRRINEDYPADISTVQPHFRETPRTEGDPYQVGRYVDEWGLHVHEPAGRRHRRGARRAHQQLGNRRRTRPLSARVASRSTTRTSTVSAKPPTKFMLAGTCPRPFEQLQFIRKTENVYEDLADPPPQMLALLAAMHAFYCELLEAWVRTDVDGIMFMDDWGSQLSLLIRPAAWRELFKPLYRDYIQIAHAAGKKAFMHSDGHILAVYPDLVEIGLDAVNSQLFCMDPAKLSPFAGKITFWGEIDRQHLLPDGTPDDIDRAVRLVHDSLWHYGGCIAQCEFGAGAKPENVRQVFESWDVVTAGV